MSPTPCSRNRTSTRHQKLPEASFSHPLPFPKVKYYLDFWDNTHEFLAELLPLHIFRVPRKLFNAENLFIEQTSYNKNNYPYCQASSLCTYKGECMVSIYGLIRHWYKISGTLWRKKLYLFKIKIKSWKDCLFYPCMIIFIIIECVISGPFPLMKSKILSVLTDAKNELKQLTMYFSISF